MILKKTAAKMCKGLSTDVQWVLILTPVEFSRVSAVVLRSVRSWKPRGTFVLKNPAFTHVKSVDVFGHNHTAFLVLICKASCHTSQLPAGF